MPVIANMAARRPLKPYPTDVGPRQNLAPHPSAPKPPKPPAQKPPSLPRQPGQVRIPGQPQVKAPGTPIYNRPPQPPPPAGGGHYTWVNGKGWQLIHAIGPANASHPLGQWAPGAPPRKPPPDPTKSTYGLNLNDKSRFNVFSMPQTQGAFNKMVLAAAQPQYLPQLQDIQGQEGAENTANKQRTADIGSIYSQYGNQAQQAFNEVKDALNQLAVQNSAGDQTARANLAAVLGSSQGGQNSLAQMMGMSGPGQGQTLPYLGAADAASQATQQQESNIGTGTLGLAGSNLTNVGNEQSTEQNTESLRHGAATQGLESQQSALVQQIPGIIEKAREQLIADLQSSQSLQFQQGLASKQFGLSQQAQNFNQNLQKKQFSETQKNDASNRAAQAATIRQNDQALANQAAATNQAAQTALAKAQGDAQKNGIQYLQSWLLPTKQELTVKTDPATGQKTTVLGNPKAWHRDVGSALKTLTTVYGLPQNVALQLMSSVGGSTYVSGQGGQTVAQWANSFNSRAAARKRASSNPINQGAKKIVGNILKF